MWLVFSVVTSYDLAFNQPDKTNYNNEQKILLDCDQPPVLF